MWWMRAQLSGKPLRAEVYGNGKRANSARLSGARLPAEMNPSSRDVAQHGIGVAQKNPGFASLEAALAPARFNALPAAQHRAAYSKDPASHIERFDNTLHQRWGRFVCKTLDVLTLKI